MAKRQTGQDPALTPVEQPPTAKHMRTAPGRPPLRVKVVMYPDGEGGYTVVVPALPGCVTEGDTREEALANLREAVEGYLLCVPGTFEKEEGAIEEEVEL